MATTLSLKTRHHGSNIWQSIRTLGNQVTPFISPLLSLLWFFPALDKIVIKYFHHHNTRRKKILLVAQNKIAADHIRLVWESLKNDDNLEFFVTDDRFFNKRISKDELTDIVPVKNVHISYASIRYWDLIIYVNHPWDLGVWLFVPFIKKIFINHGICTGKINNPYGEDGVYGKSRVLRPFAKPFYDKMFAASSFEKELAIMQTPELKSHIAVTGFLRADIIEELQKKRAEIRKRLGYAEEDIVVHIISTWGASSLFQTIGEELLLQAAKLTNKYNFMFSLHPRHDEFGDVKGRKREDILKIYDSKRIRSLNKLEWDEYVVAADIAVSDHTSLCLYYVLLNKPVILVPVQEDAYLKESAFDRLIKIAPICEQPEQLEKLIEIARLSKTEKIYIGLKELIRDYQGSAAEQYKKEIYKILRI
jgi:hypothetical protein